MVRRSFRRGMKSCLLCFVLCTVGATWLISVLSDPVRTVIGFQGVSIHPRIQSSRSSCVSSTGIFSSKSYSNSNEYSSIENNATIRQREMEMAIGKAADTLRKDYPNMFTCCPNYEIYDPDVELVDPSGVKLHGLANYKRTYGILRAIVNFLYNLEESGLTFRLLYDCTTKTIRVTWHAVLIPKAIYGGYARRVHVDGISVYEIDRETGLIYKHRLDRTLLNNIPVQYPQGIWDALQTELVEPNGIPVGVGIPAGGYWGTILDDNSMPSTKMFEQTIAGGSSSTDDGVSDNAGDNTNDGLGQDPSKSAEQLVRKNKSRANFGLKPLTMEEFLEVEREIQAQAVKQRKKIVAERAQQAISYISEKPKSGFFDKIFSGIIPGKCESNDDCERPLVCCDFVFKKICCASGVAVGYTDGRQMRPALIPVPVRPDDSDPSYPRY